MIKGRPFVFGGEPTLADAALYGQFMMLKVANGEFPAKVAKAIVPWMQSLEQWQHRGV